MEVIRETISAVMQGLVQKKKITGDGAEEALKKVLTKNELAHIKCNYFRKGILGITVDSSAVYYKLNLKKDQLLQKMKSDSFQLKDIRFHMGEV